MLRKLKGLSIRYGLQRKKTKVFCIGCNKTGTTSLADFFSRNGYVVGDQERAEQFLEDWAVRDFDRLISYCKSATFFQDIPFSFPDTFKYLDKAFPKSKFILTVRDSSDVWYRSLIKHQTQAFSKDENTPTEQDLGDAMYRGKYKGYILRVHQLVFNYPKIQLYDKDTYTQFYNKHNNQVMRYFENRQEDLLIVNLNDDMAFDKICDFVGLDKSTAVQIPHLNKR